MARTVEIDVEIAYEVDYVPHRARTARRIMVRETVPLAFEAIDSGDAPVVAEGRGPDGRPRQARHRMGADLKAVFTTDAHSLAAQRLVVARGRSAPDRGEQGLKPVEAWPSKGAGAYRMPEAEEIKGRMLRNDREAAIRRVRDYASTLLLIDGVAWAPAEPFAWWVTGIPRLQRAEPTLVSLDEGTGPGYLFALGDLDAAVRFARANDGTGQEADWRPGIEPRVMRPDLAQGVIPRIAEHAVAEALRGMPEQDLSRMPLAAMEALIDVRKAAVLCEAGVPEAADAAFAAIARMAEALPDGPEAPGPVGQWKRDALPLIQAYHAGYLAEAIARSADDPGAPAPRA